VDVPGGDGARVFDGVLGEDAERPGREHEHPPRAWGEAEVPGRQNAQDHAVGEEGDVARHVPEVVEEIVGAPPDVFGPFSFGTTIAQVRPAGVVGADLVDSEPFVAAEAHLEESVVDVGAETGEVGGAPGAGEGGDEDAFEVDGGKTVTELAGVLFPLGDEREIRAAGEAALRGPGGVAVAAEVKGGGHSRGSMRDGRWRRKRSDGVRFEARARARIRRSIASLVPPRPKKRRPAPLPFRRNEAGLCITHVASP